MLQYGGIVATVYLPTQSFESGGAPIRIRRPLRGRDTMVDVHPFGGDDDSTYFAIEQTGEDLVVFDPVRMHYHTLNAPAAAIWAACEDARTVDAAVRIAMAKNPGLMKRDVWRIVSELSDLGLIEFDERRIRRRISRRDAVKLSIASLVGAVGLPVIASITVPSSQAAASDCPAGHMCIGGQCCPCANRVCVCGGPVCTTTSDCSGGLTCISGTCGIPC